MARSSPHGGASRIRPQQQGVDSGRKQIPARARGITLSQATALARSACSADSTCDGQSRGCKGVNQRVLVVEDNALNCELLRDWLEVEGYKVLIAENLSAAMAAVDSEQPNAVLLDIQLGSEDGLALMPWMHQRPSVRQ